MTRNDTQVFADLQARGDSPYGQPQLDRISVRDFILDVEIGAFQAERGVTQRIKINVVLEVASHGAAKSDDVDLVLSYDAITDAIHTQISSERFNLLETFAERVAARVLAHPLAEQIFIRVEKLDRIPGALGVEITRQKKTQNDQGVADQKDAPAKTSTVLPLVVFLPNAVADGSDIGSWLDALAIHSKPAIICLEPLDEASLTAKSPRAKSRIDLLSIEQNAWLLAEKDSRCNVVASRTELEWGLNNKQLSIWAPSKLLLETPGASSIQNADPIEIARWLAQELGAENLMVAAPKETAPSENQRDVILNSPTQI